MSKKVKILELAAVDETIYFLLLPLMKRLRSNGYIIEASCANGNFFDKIKENGFNIHNIPISRDLNIFKHIRSIIKLQQLMRKQHYRIVHVHTPIGAAIGRIAAYIAKVPIVIYTIHGFYFHENMSPLKRKAFINIEKLLAKWTTFAFSQSNEDTIFAIKERIFDKSKILTIGNGINLEYFTKTESINELLEIRERLQINPNAIVVTCVARLNKEKGIFDLIEAEKLALNNFKNIQFLFVGGIHRENEPNAISEEFIKNYFTKNPIYRNFFKFLGVRTDVKDILAITDIFVLPSYREGMPRSIIEAMAMELPVIATNIRGSREEVVDGETGILVPVGDVNALSNAIIKLAKSPELRKGMGKKGRKRAEKYFDESKIIEKQLKVIKELLQKQDIKQR